MLKTVLFGFMDTGYATQEQYPLYFTLALGEINVNFDKEDYLPIEKEIRAGYMGGIWQQEKSWQRISIHADTICYIRSHSLTG